MMNLAFMRTATGKEDPELPLLQRIRSQSSSNRHLIPTVKHGGGCVLVWGCFAGDTVSDLFRYQATLKQHGYHSILQRYVIASGVSGTIICFSTGQ